MEYISLYNQFLLEREEILKHKWIESKKRGYDMGFENALIDWMKNHRKNWLVANGQDAPNQNLQEVSQEQV